MALRLTIGKDGRVTLPQALLTHLGVQRGDSLDVALHERGRVELARSAPPTTDVAHPAAHDPEPDLVDFSEYGQPAALRAWLPPDIPHVLVDIGAHDGLQGSNSREFLLQGWQGVLVEPMPPVFDRLRRNMAGIAGVHLLNCAVGDRDGTAELRYPRGHEAGQNASLYFQRPDDVRVSVDVRRLSTILEQRNVPRRFGLLLIDTEGGDLEVLQGLDFSRWQPAVILTEDYVPKHEAKRKLLERAGYRFRGRIGADSIWTARDLVPEHGWPEQAPPRIHPGDPARLRSGDPVGTGHVFLETAQSGPDLLCGWAFGRPDQPAPPEVAAELTRRNGTRLCFRGFRCPRSDVADHFQRPNLLMSGFRIHLPPDLDPAAIVQTVLLQKQGSTTYQQPIAAFGHSP